MDMAFEEIIYSFINCHNQKFCFKQYTRRHFYMKLIVKRKLLNCRCTPPNKSNDYQKIYSDWCHEFEKYKSAMKSWEKKQAVSSETTIYSFIVEQSFFKDCVL